MCLCGPAREGMCAWGRSEADVGISSSVISFTFVRQVFISLSLELTLSARLTGQDAPVPVSLVRGDRCVPRLAFS